MYKEGTRFDQQPESEVDLGLHLANERLISFEQLQARRREAEEDAYNAALSSEALAEPSELEMIRIAGSLVVGNREAGKRAA